MSYQQDNFKAIADAIRAKDGTTDQILPIDFPDRIRAIQTGVETDDATAVASSILQGYTAYAKGEKITGTIPSVPTTTILPSTRSQIAVEAHNYTTGNIVVTGDSNLIGSNIKSGVTIFGVNGYLADTTTPITITLKFTGSILPSIFVVYSENGYSSTMATVSDNKKINVCTGPIVFSFSYSSQVTSPKFTSSSSSVVRSIINWNMGNTFAGTKTIYHYLGWSYVNATGNATLTWSAG